MIITLDPKNDLKIKEALTPLNPNNVKYIIIHHADSINCTWQQINGWHKAKGWNCIGYNAFVDKSGDIYICRGNNVGAHTEGYNNTGYGICLEGNYELEKNIPFEQYKSVLTFIKGLQYTYPNASIKFHRQLNSTACPGKNIDYNLFVADYNLVKAALISKDKGYINSPDYWIDATLKDLNYNNAYVQQLLINLSNR